MAGPELLIYGTLGALGYGAYSSYQTAQMQADVAKQTAEYNAAMIQQHAAFNANLALGMSALAAQNIANQAQYDAAVAANNAILAKNQGVVAEQNQAIARDNTQFNVDRLRQRQRRILGAIRATAGSAGVEISGTPADLAFDSALANELDIESVKIEGAAASAGFASDIRNARYESTFLRNEATIIGIDASNRANQVLADGRLSAASILWRGNMDRDLALYTGRTQASQIRRQARHQVISDAGNMFNAGARFYGGR